ncbi:MAG: hypothetical protein M3Y42_01275 [Actinomycetota bacterium]|nr:hypothetical protein [Actinomycetota bacterium]MDQ2955580.1 hypothetical protein [Actinomycetota bacterium]
MSSIPPLFHGLFDDAALFPPGNASMPDAVRAQAGYRKSWYAGLVGPFVCPASRLTELAAELDQPVPVSVTVPGGPAEAGAAVELADSLTGVQLAVLELPVPVAELTRSITLLVAAGRPVFAEIPVTELTPAVAVALAEAGLGLKLRTGGVTAAAFPTATALGAAIGIAVESGVRFKCTAGLHHATPQTDPATGFAQHGFLNVLLAVHAALRGDQPAAALALDDPAVLAERAASLSEPAVAELRARFRSIGSCSIDEPLTDLDTLGLVAAP